MRAGSHNMLWCFVPSLCPFCALLEEGKALNH
jgi:hypothetical protein